jgi:hypothetical protein
MSGAPKFIPMTERWKLDTSDFLQEVDSLSELGGPGSGYSREEGHKGRIGKVGGSTKSDISDDFNYEEQASLGVYITKKGTTVYDPSDIYDPKNPDAFIEGDDRATGTLSLNQLRQLPPDKMISVKGYGGTRGSVRRHNIKVGQLILHWDNSNIHNQSEFGGPGSGFRGHEGRPGQVGGSRSGGGIGLLSVYATNSYRRNLLSAASKEVENVVTGTGHSIEDINSITTYGSFASDKSKPGDIDLVIEINNLKSDDYFYRGGSLHYIDSVTPVAMKENSSVSIVFVSSKIAKDEYLSRMINSEQRTFKPIHYGEEVLYSKTNNFMSRSFDSASKVDFDLGGPGSGFHGHVGRPNKVGGSLPSKYFPKNTDEAPRSFFISRLDVNKMLRQGLSEVPQPLYEDILDVKGTKNALEEAMKTPDYLENETIVYRGVSGSFANKMRLGKTFTDNGYQYVTTNQDMAKKYAKKDGVILRIALPKGQPYLPGLEDQSELILPTNMKFEVVDRMNDLVDVEVITERKK